MSLSNGSKQCSNFKNPNQPVSAASRGVCSILILSLVHSLPWNEVNYVYDFGFIPVASHGVFA
ncbi:MAG: hypothetical protein Q8O30_13060, partial [Candidatus Omnitrophota bacterium]|nr:hypothetical protein [Candidatus Omnitrophota bacterium]